MFYTRLKCLSSTWWLAAIMTSLGGRAMESLDRQSRVLPDASDEVETPASPHSDSQLPPGYSTTRPFNTQMLDKPASAVNIPDGYLHDQALPPMRPDSFEPATLAAADPETFDIFLDNFPDVNFSCAASDQLFWDMEI
jgi:hypothetical protein